MSNYTMKLPELIKELYYQFDDNNVEDLWDRTKNGELEQYLENLVAENKLSHTERRIISDTKTDILVNISEMYYVEGFKQAVRLLRDLNNL